MAKPTNLFEWIGTPVEPLSGDKTAGFSAGDRPPASWFDWFFNGAYQWHAYANNLHNEAEFLNKSYAWTGDHVFSGSIQVGGADDYLYTGSRTHVIAVPLHYGVPNQLGDAAGAQWRWKSAVTATWESLGAGSIDIPLKHLLREGMGIRAVVASVGPAASGTPMTMTLYRRDLGGLSAGDIPLAPVGSAESSSGTADQLLDTRNTTANLNEVVEADHEYFVKFTSSTSAGDELFWLVIIVDVASVRVV